MSTNDNDRLFSSIAALRLELDAMASNLDPAARKPLQQDTAGSDDVALVATARHLLALRTSIVEIFDSAQFTDPATNIMLHLFIDENEGRGTTSGACCTAAAVPRTTALRLISLLHGRHLIEMYELASDRRTTLLRLTPAGLKKISRWLGTVNSLFYSSDTGAT